MPMLDAQAEKKRNNLILERSMIPAHEYAAEKRSTSDPHDVMAPQKSRMCKSCRDFVVFVFFSGFGQIP